MPKVTVGPPPKIDTADIPAPAETPILGGDIEFLTPSGKRVKIGKPTIPVKLLLPTLLSAAEPNVMSAYATENLIRQIVHVKEIDGKPVSAIQKYQDVMAIGMLLGDDGLEALEIMHGKYFPALSEKNIQIIKK